MDNTTDLLQIKIAEARAGLSKESRAAIDDVDWKFIILGMNKRYNSEQLENLETETELLLCGISSPEEYQQELEKRMMLSKEDVISLLNDMDRLIFKKIQEKLEDRISGKGKLPSLNKPSVSNQFFADKSTNKILVLDPRFISMPKGIQEAIAKSNWKERLYEISKKYKINIEQMGILEETTTKVILNEIHPDKYEGELASGITISREDISSLVKDVNESILKRIKEIMENQSESSNQEGNDKIPLPPYAKIETKIEETPKQVESTIEKPEVVIKPIETTEPAPETANPPKNIIEEKLQGATVSEHTVSDHSDTKIDPYREAF